MEPKLGTYTVHLAIGCDTAEEAEEIRDRLNSILIEASTKGKEDEQQQLLPG